MARIRCGAIGWSYPEWVGPFYPPGSTPSDLLHHYADRYPIVEAATAYYGMPRKSTAARWAASTPEDFRFFVKVPDWIIRKKADDPDRARALRTLLTHLDPLVRSGKLGAMIAQFHPSFQRTSRAQDLEAFLAALPPGPHWAVELRHASWWRDETYDALRQAGVTLVWSTRGGSHETPPVMTTDRIYARLLGDRELPPPFDARRRDMGDELRAWAERIQTAASAATRIDIAVSNHLEGFAPASIERFTRMLGLEQAAERRGLQQTTLT